ncbi:receptor-type tyrosine-protein phosphatase H isoform X1 [Neodiprion fabricii]|uniref:receptor-type tyrosine-protein phosphatase H isoform X1 n=1 Tax=Neodiprion fabricii TaxID=2872261 RepID=UPI001ED8E63C|nr:receptor-type tyrosine-protein phosphatase H isoform X1 [Neodiprion fabricii]XP_046430616.1 receptor-type tyrosine-protein phosphatase H isoform X1 [Neodiprion fabricii]XP_046430617.1 receptor-type tyrosine-protein phosphatase H isoform X1 [Neodiprion fabricii]XP_046430618.1 receptor-type tyrosine-protein phosphatase H isoform X1 [Neodiprion fabricii]
MIPRKNIKFVLCTFYLLYSFENGGKTVAETRQNDAEFSENTISSNDYESEYSSVSPTVNLEPDTTVDYFSTTKNSETRLIDDTTDNSTTLTNGTSSEVNCTDTPSSVQNLTVSSTYSSLTLSWSPVVSSEECIQLYNITWNSESSDDFDYDIVYSPASEYVISNLTSCTSYVISVVVVGENGNVSNATTVTGNTTESQIPQVNNLDVEPLEYGLNVTWDPPDNLSCLKYYLVNVTAEGDFVENLANASSEVTFYTFSNLSACTMYTVQVTPISTNDNYGTASRINGETSASTPGAVRNLTVLTQNITESSIYLTWSEPSLNPTCVLYYKVDTCYENNCTEDITASLFYNATSLSPCRSYTFNVSAVGSNHSSESATETARTTYLAPGEVSGLAAPSQNVTGYSVYLTWSEPSLNPTCILNYSISICNDNNCTENHTRDVFYNATSLDPCLTYTFTVNAIGFVGSSHTANTTATTSYVTPGIPTSMTVTPGQYSLYVSWEPPSTAPTCVNHYQVMILNGTTHSITDTNITLSDLIACKSYIIQITPVWTSDEGESGTIEGTTEESVDDPPVQDIVPWVTKSTISVGWHIDRDNNECGLTSVLTYCNYTISEGRGYELVNGFSTDDISTFSSGTNVTINVTLYNLSPFTYYECYGVTVNSAGQSVNGENVTVRTSEDVPSAPSLEALNLTSSTFNLVWESPNYLPGNLIEYEIILGLQRLFLQPSFCIYNDSSKTISDINGTTLAYAYLEAVPYSNYSASIKARTNAGWGNYSNYISFQTLAGVPGAVNNVEYSNKTNASNIDVLDTFLSWQLPCSLNGEIEFFNVYVSGTRDGYDDHEFNRTYNVSEIVDADTKFTMNFGQLRAEYSYIFQISTKVKGVSEKGPLTNYSVIYPAGIPPLPSSWYMTQINIDPYKAQRSLSTAWVLLPLFENTNGEIQYYAIMVSEIGQSTQISHRLDVRSGEWPNATLWQEAMPYNPVVSYQATPVRWHPASTDNIVESGKIKAIKFMLGGNLTCPKLTSNSNREASYCNGPLQSDLKYEVRMRAFTNGGYQDSETIIVITKAEFNLGLVIGVVSGILFFGIIFLMMLLMRKGSWQALIRNPLNPIGQTSPVPDPFSRKKFEIHCQDLSVNPGKLSNEFQLLQTLSVDLQMSTNVASLQANRKKNRYTDILPYDFSRVKLEIIDNDPNTDYINASFIHGYSGAVEYIASQGPKEETTYDFWRMIFQYNVKVIVMVTQLVEKGKEKCHQYYPNMREHFEYEDITIRCSTQLDFVFYTQRNIVLQKGNDRRTLMHLHFKEWSDHGIPDDFHSMIQFCQIVRRHINESKSVAVIHCSAGVGRTGTLMAIDILLQQIRDSKKLDVFGTVFNLRKDRINMVQTESQYAYIYNCTRQTLNNPYPARLAKPPPIEPIYENLTKKKKSITDSNTNLVNSIETLKKISPSSSMDSMEQIYEFAAHRPIYSTQLSTLSTGLRYSKSTSAINTQAPPSMEIVRYGSHEYPIFEPAPDTISSRGSMDRNVLLEFARPLGLRMD